MVYDMTAWLISQSHKHLFFFFNNELSKKSEKFYQMFQYPYSKLVYDDIITYNQQWLMSMFTQGTPFLNSETWNLYTIVSRPLLSTQNPILQKQLHPMTPFSKFLAWSLANNNNNNNNTNNLYRKRFPEQIFQIKIMIYINQFASFMTSILNILQILMTSISTFLN